MTHELPDKDAPVSDYRNDTWEHKEDAGVWYIHPVNQTRVDGFMQSNDWFRATIATTFDAFRTLLRVREVEIGITYQEGSPFRTEVYTWTGAQSYQAFFDHVLSRIAEFPTAIYKATFKTESYVYVHTPTLVDMPVRVWIYAPMRLLFWGGPTNQPPFACLEINHTLFCPISFTADLDNTELYALNHPLLEGALRQWEQRLGAQISEIEGVPGVYQYGFLPLIVESSEDD